MLTNQGPRLIEINKLICKNNKAKDEHCCSCSTLVRLHCDTIRVQKIVDFIEMWVLFFQSPDICFQCRTQNGFMFKIIIGCNSKFIFEYELQINLGKLVLMQNDSSIHHSKYFSILLIWEKLSFCDNNKTLQTVDQILKLKTKKSLNLLNLHMHVNQLKLKYLISKQV